MRSQSLLALLLTSIQSGLHIFIESLLQRLLAGCSPMQDVCTHLTAAHPHWAALQHVQMLTTDLPLPQVPSTLRHIAAFVPAVGSEAIVV